MAREDALVSRNDLIVDERDGEQTEVEAKDDAALLVSESVTLHGVSVLLFLHGCCAKLSCLANYGLQTGRS